MIERRLINKDSNLEVPEGWEEQEIREDSGAVKHWAHEYGFEVVVNESSSITTGEMTGYNVMVTHGNYSGPVGTLNDTFYFEDSSNKEREEIKEFAIEYAKAQLVIHHTLKEAQE